MPVIAITPIIGGRALKGPAARMMRDMGYGTSAAAVAEMYRDFLDAFVLDRADTNLAPLVDKLLMRVFVTNTLLSGFAQRKALARAVLRAAGAS